MKEYHKIYKKPQTKYHYINIFFGDDTIFIKDEKFRNLYANFIVIKGDNFSDVQAKLIHIDEIYGDDDQLDQDEFTRRMDNFDIGYDVNSALVFVYVHHEEGLSFLTVAPSLLEGKNLTVYERDDDFSVRLDNKWEAVADLEFEYLHNLNVNADFDIEEYKSKVKDDSNLKVDEKISDLRNLNDLDDFRSEEYPDDILVFFFKEGCSAEGMWVRYEDNGPAPETYNIKIAVEMRVRYEDINEEHEIFGTLLNQPNQNMGVNKGDKVKFKIIKADGDSFCCCDLDE